jgi:hypothetical protein
MDTARWNEWREMRRRERRWCKKKEEGDITYISNVDDGRGDGASLEDERSEEGDAGCGDKDESTDCT